LKRTGPAGGNKNAGEAKKAPPGNAGGKKVSLVTALLVRSKRARAGTVVKNEGDKFFTFFLALVPGGTADQHAETKPAVARGDS